MTTALYRRYRPETFADVIGQEHVTDPLRQALRADRTTHAYLFSGPRGCGKTTSARILARCLNCVDGPTDTPCGKCDSCIDLARDGSGSLDVVEIDAASHNGVDDARELRERALFAPARDRYKVFILDEAHMVTSQGFNALLKLVEEPPPHVKFVFATTEPEKVIGTIRSRTHHYPFRLVPPEALIKYLERLSEKEDVAVGAGVLPLVVRAGGGSVRDTLSVLDQLMAGAGESGVDYELAATLLGYTPDSLLDDVTSAIAARDGASVFQIVDRVIESGHDPRRFVEDLLERFRDLVVIAAAGEHAEALMRGIPSDQLERMRSQTALFSSADISRAADITNDALSEMTGATSPRLHLELLCARLLLISVPEAAAQPAQPVEAGTGASPKTKPEPVPAPSIERPAPSKPEAEPARPAPEQDPSKVASTETKQETATRETVPPATATAPESEAEPEKAASAPAEPAQAATTSQKSAAPGVDANTLRRRWPEVLDTLSRQRRVTWALVSQNAQVVEVAGTTVRLGFTTQALANTFSNGPHADHVREAIGQTLGADLNVEPVSGSGSNPGSSAAGPAQRSSHSENPTPRDSRPTSWDSPPPSAGATAPSWDPDPAQTDPGALTQAETEPANSPGSLPAHRPWETAAAASQIGDQTDEIPDNVRQLRTKTTPTVVPADDEPSDDDEILEDSDSVGVPLVKREMGGEIIAEITEE